MKGNFKQWLCVFTPLLLILALLLYAGSARRYDAEDITPELCRELIRRDYAKYGQRINVDNLEIIDIQKVDDLIVAGYCLNNSDFGLLEFREWGKHYIVQMRRPSFELIYHELGHDDIRPNTSNKNYFCFLIRGEKLKRIEFWLGNHLEREYDVENGPVMLVWPTPSTGRYSFLDAEGKEIEYLQFSIDYSI